VPAVVAGSRRTWCDRGDRPGYRASKPTLAIDPNRVMSRPSRKPALGQFWDSQIVTLRDIK